MDTPISEGGCGVAAGGQGRGYRPIVEIMFSDFLRCRMDLYMQSGGKAAFYDGRTGKDTARRPGACRKRDRRGGAAFPKPRGMVLPCAGAQSRYAVDAV